MTPTAKTSLQVTSNPKRVICFVTNKFDKMPCMQIKLTKACFPIFKKQRLHAVTATTCKRNSISFIILFLALRLKTTKTTTLVLSLNDFLIILYLNIDRKGGL